MPALRRDRSPGDRRQKWAKPGAFEKNLERSQNKKRLQGVSLMSGKRVLGRRSTQSVETTCARVTVQIVDDGKLAFIPLRHGGICRAI
jgi:hypothetical protein